MKYPKAGTKFSALMRSDRDISKKKPQYGKIMAILSAAVLAFSTAPLDRISVGAYKGKYIMSDKNTLDLGDIDARPRQLDDTQASEITGGFVSKGAETKKGGSAQKSKPASSFSKTAPTKKTTSLGKTRGIAAVKKTG